MSSDLLEEIRQRKPFASLAQEAYLSIQRTETVLHDAMDRVLKPHGIAQTQYNVLRMLRGAGPEGLCRNDIRDRLITRMPDVTRLLDRMEEAGLVVRIRSTDDRRLVHTRLTKQGRTLVDRLDDEVADEHERQLGHMSADQLQMLVQLLMLARQVA